MKAVLGKKIFDGKGFVENAYIVFEKNIVSVQKEKPDDCEIIGEYEYITPGIVDGHSHIGLDRAAEPYDESDINDQMDSILFNLNALDGLVMDDQSFRDSVEHGVLYSCILPGSGNIVGGMSVLIRNYAKNSDEAYIMDTGMKIAVGYNPKSTDDWKGTRPTTRMGTIGMLREAILTGIKTNRLIENDKKSIDEIEPHKEIMIKVARGEIPLRIHAHKIDDILAVIRLGREFGIKFTIEHACDLHTLESFKILKNNNIPVIYGPIDSFSYKVELKHESWKNVRFLIESGVNFGMMSDHPVMLQRNIMMQMRYFMRYGMSKEECINKLTAATASILGAEKFVGSIEKGKHASFVCWNKDPFSFDAMPVQVFCEGSTYIN